MDRTTGQPWCPRSASSQQVRFSSWWPLWPCWRVVWPGARPRNCERDMQMVCLMALLYNFNLCRSISQISSFFLTITLCTCVGMWSLCVWGAMWSCGGEGVFPMGSFLSGWQQVPLPTEPSLRMITLKGCVSIKEFFKVEEMNLKVIQSLC